MPLPWFPVLAAIHLVMLVVAGQAHPATPPPLAQGTPAQPPTSWTVETHPAASAVHGMGQCMALDVPDDHRAVMRCEASGQIRHVVTQGTNVVTLAAALDDGRALHDLQPQAVNARGEVAGRAALADGTVATVAWTAHGVKIAPALEDTVFGAVQYLTDTGLAVVEVPTQGDCRVTWDTAAGKMHLCRPGLPRTKAPGVMCALRALADDGSAVQKCQDFRFVVHHHTSRQQLPLQTPSGLREKTVDTFSASGKTAVGRYTTMAGQQVIATFTAAGYRVLPGSAAVAEGPVQVLDDGIVRTPTSLLVPGRPGEDTVRLVPLLDHVKALTGQTTSSVMKVLTPYSALASTVTPHFGPEGADAARLRFPPVPVESVRVLRSPTPLADAAHPLERPAAAPVTRPRFTWAPVEGLKGEVGCDPRRHTLDGQVIARCRDGLVHLTAAGRRTYTCPTQPDQGSDPDVYDVAETGWAVGRCGGQRLTRWAPDGTATSRAATLYQVERNGPRIGSNGAVLAEYRHFHGISFWLWKAPGSSAPELLTGSMHGPTLTAHGLAMVRGKSGMRLFDGSTEIPFQEGQRYWNWVAVTHDGAHVLASAGDIAPVGDTPMVWLHRDRPPTPVTAQNLALEVNEGVGDVTSSGWVRTSTSVCPGTPERLEPCVPWASVVAGLPPGDGLRVVDLLDDGTALGVIGHDAHMTVVILTPQPAVSRTMHMELGPRYPQAAARRKFSTDLTERGAAIPRRG